MRRSIGISVPLLAVALPLTSMAQERSPAKPPPSVVREIVQGMPKGEKQEVRVLVATVKPGEATPFHTHRVPGTVYV